MEPVPAGASAPRGGSKLARVLELLPRDHGATIDELIAATGWLAHTTRAALTGLRKRGFVVAIDQSDNERGSFYRIRAEAADKGQVHEGLHDPIVDRERWGRVELLLAEHAQGAAGNCLNSDALLTGKLFDDRGNRMSPTHAAKGAWAMALLCLAGRPARVQARGGIGSPGAGARDRATGHRSRAGGLVRFEPAGLA
jgi:hypothetical protein